MSASRHDLVHYLADLGWRDPPEPAPAGAGAGVTASAPEAATLAELAHEVSGCTRCGLAAGRTSVVFGEGSPDARLMLIGEAPGSEEDRSGRPFVGQAGQLLDEMIRALGLARDEVYIANVVKCRPPGNRNPEAGEMAACAGFLDRQIALVAPEVILALGRVSACRLAGSERSMRELRGRWSSYRGVPLLATYHPAYLLRTPRDKRLVWEDLKLVRARLAG